MQSTLPSHRIRKLWPFDLAAFRRHLLRLDAETRRARFGTAVNDCFLEDYADTAFRLDAIIYVAARLGEIHASAELRPLGPEGPAMAEAAFTVERGYQDLGLGSTLMDRIITAAQNRGIGSLYMTCLRDNDRMRHLAGKFGARLSLDEGDLTGQIEPSYPTPVSVFDEAMRDAQGFMTAVLEWGR
jgi:GNAT superfamily N-acetyltransferase